MPAPFLFAVLVGMGGLRLLSWLADPVPLPHASVTHPPLGAGHPYQRQGQSQSQSHANTSIIASSAMCSQYPFSSSTPPSFVLYFYTSPRDTEKDQMPHVPVITNDHILKAIKRSPSRVYVVRDTMYLTYDGQAPLASILARRLSQPLTCASATSLVRRSTRAGVAIP